MTNHGDDARDDAEDRAEAARARVSFERIRSAIEAIQAPVSALDKLALETLRGDYIRRLLEFKRERDEALAECALLRGRIEAQATTIDRLREQRRELRRRLLGDNSE